jgi:dCTP deaminase
MCWEMTEEKGWVLQPGIGYLMHTEECIYTKKYVPVLDGKSSIGRLFVQIHITAGFGDPNYFGQYTLEVVAHHPIRIFPGMRIAQIRFHTIAGHVKNMYEGNYKGASARGAVASRAWKQFG